MALSSDQIASITSQVYQQFPEIKGTPPAVHSQASAKTPGAPDGRFVLTYRGRGAGVGGHSILRIVRVVADERGQVLKISTSR